MRLGWVEIDLTWGAANPSSREAVGREGRREARVGGGSTTTARRIVPTPARTALRSMRADPLHRSQELAGGAMGATMRIDISFLPALAAAFVLAFARIGAMVMLLPGLGEQNIPVRVKLSIALLLTLIILPLHRSAYQVDLQSFAGPMVLMVHEIVIGIVLGATARVTLAALQVAGAVIAQQMGLGFVTSVDPTQGQQGVLIGNFLTMLGVTLLFATDSHHLVISALNDSYAVFGPGEIMPSGDVAALATRAFTAAFRIGLQLSAPFLVFGLVFNIGLGVLARLMPQMQVYFVGVPLSIFAGFLIFGIIITAMMGTFLDYFIGVIHQMMPLK
jgi:flagellar biosynthesis protein FliR